MNALLLDTHVLLWWFDSPRHLSEEAEQAILDPDRRVYLSTASIWEMSIKRSVGRLHTPSDLLARLREDQIDVMPIRPDHALAVATLPLHHRDPFDRMLVVQARLEGLTLVTRDPSIPRYDVPVLKA